MKTSNIFRLLSLLAIVGLISFGCSPEASVEPRGGNSPGLAALGDTVHTTPDTICGQTMTGNIVDALDQTGSGNIFGADVYGTWEIIATPQEMFLQVSLGRGWFVKQAYVWMGASTNIPRLSGGNVDAENLPINAIVDPVKNLYEVAWPITNDMQCPNASWIYAKFIVCELDFLGLPFNDTPVWCEGTPTGTDGSQWWQYCAVPCGETGPDIDSVTVGNCGGCSAQITGYFYDCDSVSVSSCKDIDCVELVFTDCTTERFCNLCGNSSGGNGGGGGYSGGGHDDDDDGGHNYGGGSYGGGWGGNSGGHDDDDDGHNYGGGSSYGGGWGGNSGGHDDDDDGGNSYGGGGNCGGGNNGGGGSSSPCLDSGTLAGTGSNAGKQISHIFVKSGCTSGRGVRIDGPCVTTCNSGGGGNCGGGGGGHDDDDDGGSSWGGGGHDDDDDGGSSWGGGGHDDDDDGGNWGGGNNGGGGNCGGNGGGYRR